MDPLAWVSWVPGNPLILRRQFWNPSIFRRSIKIALLCTQVGLVLPRGKKIFQVFRGFELGSTGQKAAMLAPRPRLLHIFFSKLMKVIFTPFFIIFHVFLSLYVILLGIFWILNVQNTLDSTELDLWDCYYSNFMTHSFYQKKFHTCTFVHLREIQNQSFSY